MKVIILMLMAMAVGFVLGAFTALGMAATELEEMEE